MKYVYIALIVVFAGIVLLFKVQNLTSVTVSLFAASVTLPISVLVLSIYALGVVEEGPQEPVDVGGEVIDDGESAPRRPGEVELVG